MTSSLDHLIRSAALVDKLTQTRATFKVKFGDQYDAIVAIHREGIINFARRAAISPGEAAIRLAKKFSDEPGHMGQDGAAGVLAAYVEMMEDGAIAATNALLAGEPLAAAEALAGAAISGRVARDVEQ